MGMIGTAFGKALSGVIEYGCKVTEVKQDGSGVTVTYVPTKGGGPAKTVRADWCVNTIPASVLSQIPMNVGDKMQAAINALSYGASIKVGLAVQAPLLGGGREDLRRHQLHRPAERPDQLSEHRLLQQGQGRAARRLHLRPQRLSLRGHGRPRSASAAPSSGARSSTRSTSAEFENGVSVAWHRVPWVLGCAGSWDDELRAEHYDNLCQIDGRIVLAGEHASYIPAWQEGAITSSLDAIQRLHARAVAA
jgi:monoamine oxidase